MKKDILTGTIAVVISCLGLGVNLNSCRRIERMEKEQENKTKVYEEFQQHVDFPLPLNDDETIQIDSHLGYQLDNVVYRLGYGSSRTQARMLVTHGYFEVNGQKVDIPSYLVKPGDIIAVREIRRDNKIIKENVELNAAKPVPEWLEKDEKNLSGKVVRLASREDVDIPVEEHLIVELYSK